MKRAWLVVPCLFFASCFEFYSCLRGGGGGGTCCSARAVVSSGVPYEGLIPPGDGGSTTRVRLLVTDAGVAQLTFVRDGVEVVETFAAP